MSPSEQAYPGFLSALIPTRLHYTSQAIKQRVYKDVTKELQIKYSMCTHSRTQRIFASLKPKGHCLATNSWAEDVFFYSFYPGSSHWDQKRTWACLVEHSAQIDPQELKKNTELFKSSGSSFSLSFYGHQLPPSGMVIKNLPLSLSLRWTNTNQ